jgi:Pyridoxamine 5'-phosphate oxidase
MTFAPSRRLWGMQPLRTDNLAKLYDMPDMGWERAEEALGHGSVGRNVAAFLGTIGAVDGKPHVAPIGVAVHDDALFFTAGLGTGKARNLINNPACTMALRLDGLDLSLEGEARRVEDPDLLTTVAALYAEGGWPARADTEAMALAAPSSAQSAGPGPWPLWRFTINKAVGVATAEPHSASRWTFAG